MGISWRHRNSDETQQDVPAPFAPLTDRRPDEQPAPDIEVVVEEEVVAGDTSRSDDKMVLRTDNLVKKYGKRTVANHVSIDVTQGEIVGLLGPNGAGKTTTFYMTVGLIEPNEGRYFSMTLISLSSPSTNVRRTASATLPRRRRYSAR